jgi:hypothetical protein
MDSETDATWLTVAKAAPRLGLTPDGLRSRIKRGQISARKGNDGRLLVGVVLNGSDPGHEPGHEPAGPGSAEPDHNLLQDLLAARERAARAEGELAAEARRSTDLMAALAAERTRAEGECTALRAQVAALQAELALARKGWLERVLEAIRRR